MAVSFQAAGALVGTVTLPQLSIVAPTCAADDILIAAINAKDNQVWTAPAGWTIFDESNNTTAQRVTLAWKRAVTADSGATFSFTVPIDNNITYHGMISAWRGCITTGTPIDATTPTASANASSDTVTYADFNPTSVMAWVVAIGFYNEDLTTAGTIAGTNPTFANNWDLEDGTGTDASIFGYSGSSLTSAATGARSHTTTSMADAINVGVLFGLVAASIPNAALFFDDFDRANSDTVGGNWVETSGDWDILSNKLHKTAQAAAGYLVLNTSSIGSADYDVEADITISALSTPAPSGPGLAGRATNSSNFYLAHCNNATGVDDFELYSVVAGVFSLLGSWPASPSMGSTTRTIKLSMRGTLIRMFVDNIERIRVTNSALTLEGDFGVRVYDPSVNLDDFDNYAILPPVDPIPPPFPQRVYQRGL